MINLFKRVNFLPTTSNKFGFENLQCLMNLEVKLNFWTPISLKSKMNWSLFENCNFLLLTYLLKNSQVNNLDHVWPRECNDRCVALYDRWKTDGKSTSETVFTTTLSYLWPLAPRNKLIVRLNISHHVIHLFHWISAQQSFNNIFQLSGVMRDTRSKCPH